MAATSFNRGHKVVWDGSQWLYDDTKEPSNYERPCPRCGHMPTPEGHDHCLGHIDGVTSACCGHGVHKGFILYKDGRYEPIKKE